MSQEKLLSVNSKNVHARRLQRLMLDYHEFRVRRDNHPLAETIDRLGEWQIQRLKFTYRHFYAEPRYHDALNFLLKDLYAPRDFVRRDADLERIFPKMVKLVPNQALATVANLVELNLLTQKLDEHLASELHKAGMHGEITEENYLRGFRACNNLLARRHQLHLISSTGLQLERYVNNKFLGFTLRLTEKPADMAGLGQLHQFITRGFSAFKAMGGVSHLLRHITHRENTILELISAGAANPFGEDQHS